VAAGGHGLHDDDLQGRLGDAVSIDEPLERERLPVTAGGSDEAM
jgi:hypothetical protein